MHALRVACGDSCFNGREKGEMITAYEELERLRVFVSSLIESLEKEPEPQGLDEAAKAFNDTFKKDWEIEGDYVYIPTAKVIASTAFKAGAKWMAKKLGKEEVLW